MVLAGFRIFYFDDDYYEAFDSLCLSSSRVIICSLCLRVFETDHPILKSLFRSLAITLLSEFFYNRGTMDFKASS